MRLDWICDATLAAGEVAARFPGAAEATIAHADEICENAFAFRGHWEMERTHVPVRFTGEIDWEHVEMGDPEWTFAFSRHTFLVVLGRAWRLTGDAKYQAAFERLIADWIARAPLTEASAKTTWRPIEAGLRAENWLRALALFGRVPDGVEQSLRAHADWLLTSHGEFQRLSNWGVLQDHGLYLLGLAMGEAGWRDEAAARLCEQLSLQVLGDGVHWEQSPMYHCEVLHCCLSAALAARRFGEPLPQALLDKTHRMALALGAMVRPDGLLICQSDTDEIDARDLLALAALLFKDPALKGAAASGLYEDNLWDFADRITEYNALPEDSSRKSSALLESGNYQLISRRGFAHFRCGSLGSGHGHADLLHVDLVSNGESILQDSGRYTYVDSPVRRKLKSPAAHNTIVVDGADFSVPEGSWGYSAIAEPLKGEHRFMDEADFVRGAHMGYFHLGVLPRRALVRLGDGLWVIVDALHATGRHAYEHHFHFGPEGRARIDGQGAVYEGKRCSARLAFLGEGLRLDMGNGPVSREYNKLEDADHLRVSHEAEGFASLITVIATGDGAPKLGIEALPVSTRIRKRSLSKEQALAVRIEADGAQWTLIACHGEIISEVDLIEASGHAGYGKLMAFGPDGQTRVLNW